MRIVRALKTVNYRLLAAVFATMLLPTIYQTVRIYFLGNLPSDSGINFKQQANAKKPQAGLAALVMDVYLILFCG